MRIKYLLLCLVPFLFCVKAQAQDYKDLIGRWVRPDGGYVLIIKDIDENGDIDATYLQPRNINVSQAEILTEDDKEYIYIELQDAGYPGSNYTLTYDKDKDRLVGVYYHAVLRQSFDIYFERQIIEKEKK